MSLMHLLTVGQCFKGIDTRPGHYKLETSSLPKFAPVNRPVSLAPASRMPTAYPAPTQTSLFSELVARPALSPDQEAPVLQKPAKPAPPMESSFPAPAPAYASAPSSSKPVVSAPLFSRARKDDSWKSIIRELFFGRRRRPANTVQTELALDRITVVRNDLSETDIEVVAKKTQSQSFATSHVVVPPPKQAKDWVRLTIGLLRPKKSEFHPSQGVASPVEQKQTPELIRRR